MGNRNMRRSVNNFRILQFVMVQIVTTTITLARGSIERRIAYGIHF